MERRQSRRESPQRNAMNASYEFRCLLFTLIGPSYTPHHLSICDYVIQIFIQQARRWSDQANILKSN